MSSTTSSNLNNNSTTTTTSSSSSSATTTTTSNNDNISNQFYRLKVEDALSYLDQVKLQFERSPDVYNQFLEIMKEFKSQAIDTPGVISRVSNLFRGHTDLIEGFNTFLPPGYKIEVHANDAVHFTAPNSTLSTIIQPPTMINSSINKETNDSQTTIPPKMNGNATIYDTYQQQQQQQLSVKILPTAAATPSQTLISQMANAVVSSSSSSSSSSTPPLTATTTTTNGNKNQIITGNNTNSQVTTNNNNQSQVEFGHAINYVNKIKSRFHNQPDIYKQFLEILHTYQKQQKNLRDGLLPQSATTSQSFISETEVYSKVAKLFKNQEDLLVEFSQFLPDASGNNSMNVVSSINSNNNPPKNSNTIAPIPMHATNFGNVNYIINNINSPIPMLQQSMLNVPIMTVFPSGHNENPSTTTTTTSTTLPSPSSKKIQIETTPKNDSKINQQQPSPNGPPPPPPSSQKRNQNNISSYSTTPTNKKQKTTTTTTTTTKTTSSTIPYLSYSSQNLSHQDGTINAKYQNLPLNEYSFFDHLKKALRTQQVYENFLKCLVLFNQDIIDRHELIQLVEPFLGKFANLYRWFKDYVENKSTNINETHLLNQSKGGINSITPDQGRFTTNNSNSNITNRLNLPIDESVDLEIDYLSCKQHGASYRDVSSYSQPISSGQTALCKQVLNGTYVSFPSWSEDSTFISSKKNQYEELIFRVEDERFELDVVLETNMAAIRVLENVMNKISHMSTEELSKFRLTNSLGGSSEVIYIKAIQRIYLDKAKDFIDGMRRNPSVAVPLVLKRLKAKDEEWRESKKILEKQWKEHIERNYLKSLDYCAASFKQNDQRQLKTKHFIDEIENLYYKRQEQRKNEMLAQKAGVAAVVPLIEHHQPHVSFVYEDKSILEDAAALIIHHVKRQTAIQKEDKQKIKQIVYHFLPDLLFVPRGALSDDESSEPIVNHLNTDEDPKTKDSAKIKKQSRSSPVANQSTPSSSPARQHTDTNKRRLTSDSSSTTKLQADNEYSKTSEDMYRLFFVNQHWYLFFRYHHILCKRLLKIYKIALAISKKEQAEAKKRDESVADALKLRTKSEIPVDEYYIAFLDIVRNLLDGNMESGQYEDTLREMFGIHAYVSFTLDKVVHNCVRQVTSQIHKRN
jgi:paired amphipathic helix protein Sin3a